MIPWSYTELLSLQQGTYNTNGGPAQMLNSGYIMLPSTTDRRPLIDRLATARHNEETTKAGLEKRVQESIDKIAKIDEALVYCDNHPHIVRFFDVLKKIGLT